MGLTLRIPQSLLQAQLKMIFRSCLRYVSRVDHSPTLGATETVQLSSYWVTFEDGVARFWGKTIRCWPPHDPTDQSFKKAYHVVQQVVKWARDHVYNRLKSDLTLLEDSPPREANATMTPPDSDQRSRSRKRKSPLDVQRDSRSASSLRTSLSVSYSWDRVAKCCAVL